MREAGKSSLYRHEVRRAAVDAVVQAVRDVAAGDVGAGAARLLATRDVFGRPRPLLTQAERAIDWTRDGTDTVLRRIRAAEGHPGVLDSIGGEPFHLFGGHRETALRGRPGELIAQRHGADLPRDGRRRGVDHAPEGAGLASSCRPRGRSSSPACRARRARSRRRCTRPSPETWREIAYEERDGVGYLHFDFYNGAMSTDQCRRLREAYRYAPRRPTRVIVLMGGRDFFSNGIHLNVIEAADDPATESWWNLHAIDDVVREIVETDSHLVVSALAGDAAAGGVPFALAADHVVAREDVVLNPYYQHMGGLYGSEYWTYLMPRRIGHELTDGLTSAPFEPVGTRRAVEIGLLDDAFGEDVPRFRGQVARARHRAGRPSVPGDAARGQAALAAARRADQAALGLPHRGAGQVTRVLLRARPQLPRGAPPLRAQARRAVPGHAGGGATGGLSYSLRARLGPRLTASAGRSWLRRTYAVSTGSWVSSNESHTSRPFGRSTSRRRSSRSCGPAPESCWAHRHSSCRFWVVRRSTVRKSVVLLVFALAVLGCERPPLDTGTACFPVAAYALAAEVFALLVLASDTLCSRARQAHSASAASAADAEYRASRDPRRRIEAALIYSLRARLGATRGGSFGCFG